jgi:hypothetical protein
VTRLASILAGLGVLGLTGCGGSEPPPGEACLSCHAGIEPAHRTFAEGECTICHGGDGSATAQAAAHVAIPADWEKIRGTGLPPAPYGFIKDFAPDQLARLDPAYLRFLNPGDIRVVNETCGRCHPEHVEFMRNSVMTTNAGHYYPPLFLAGFQPDLLARYGSFPASDSDCDPTKPGVVCDLETLAPPSDSEIQDAVDSGDPLALEEVAYRHYLAKNCNTCHQAGYPRNDSPGLYRSTGCTACHMVYDKLGVYQGGDPTIAKGTPVHPRAHEITTAIPTEQCTTCHFQGGRIGLAFRGIREGGFGAAHTPTAARPIEETLYGHAPGYYFTDEDTTNTIDETPPDLHYAAGLHCADCHVGVDVHGDDHIYSTSKQQVDIRCEDCHGTVRQAAGPGADGLYRTASGRVLPQLSTGGDGGVVLTGIVDGAEHVVPQPADILAGGWATEAMRTAMGEDASGWSHTDSLTCDTCHTSYNQMCIGCHVSFDLRLDQVDYQTGTLTTGFTRGGRSTYSLSNVLLGMAPSGRIQSVVPSQQVQMAIFGAARFGTEDGALLRGGRIDDGMGGTRVVGEFRHGGGFAANNGFLPYYQHSAARRPRACSTCHRRDDSPKEWDRVRGVYGYGTGEFLLAAPDGTWVDGLQFLDDDGNPITTWAYDQAGPIAPARRDQALGVVIDVDRP